jgi:DNA-directed RNA polymerase subunit F
MILNEKPLLLGEVSELAGDSDQGKEIKKFIKKFSKLKVEDAKKMKEELEGLDILQLKEKDIVSLVNFVPKDGQEVMKVLQGISFNQEEVDKILNVTKNY